MTPKHTKKFTWRTALKARRQMKILHFVEKESRVPREG